MDSKNSIKRFAIFALISIADTRLIRAEQLYLAGLTKNSLALGFPVHITIKGRFLAIQDVVERVINNVSLSSISHVQLSKPKYIKPQLSWLEVLSNSEGFSKLAFLHQLFEQNLREFVVEDEVPEDHKNLEFRPHITLGWGVTSSIWQEYSSNRRLRLRRIRISHIALASYPRDWPRNEAIELVLKIPI